MSDKLKIVEDGVEFYVGRALMRPEKGDVVEVPLEKTRKSLMASGAAKPAKMSAKKKGAKKK